MKKGILLLGLFLGTMNGVHPMDKFLRDLSKCFDCPKEEESEIEIPTLDDKKTDKQESSSKRENRKERDEKIVHPATTAMQNVSVSIDVEITQITINVVEQKTVVHPKHQDVILPKLVQDIAFAEKSHESSESMKKSRTSYDLVSEKNGVREITKEKPHASHRLKDIGVPLSKEAKSDFAKREPINFEKSEQYDEEYCLKNWRKIDHPIKFWYRNQKLKESGLGLTKKLEREEFYYSIQWMAQHGYGIASKKDISDFEKYLENKYGKE